MPRHGGGLDAGTYRKILHPAISANRPARVNITAAPQQATEPRRRPKTTAAPNRILK
jgi:hypothetical protein